MKNTKRKFVDDCRGISVMQDAILFCVMVSISAAILMPVLTGNTIQRAYIEKENEERVDEILHEFMTCRVDEFKYVNVDIFLDKLGINSSENLLRLLMKSLLEREMLHRTYVDICTECMACQFEFFGKQINILTKNFTRMVEIELRNFFGGQFTNKYGYNFTAVWAPITGFEFGGRISIGDPVPSEADVYTASTYVVMPSSLFTTDLVFLLNDIRWHIENYKPLNENISTFVGGEITEETLRKNLSILLTDLFNKIIWEGFGDGTESILDMAIDYIIQSIERVIKNTFDDALNITSATAAKAGYGNFSVLINSIAEDIFSKLLPYVDKSLPVEEALQKIRQSIKENARNFVNETIREQIHSMVDSIIGNIREIGDMREEIIDWIFQHISFCRAKMMLSIWRM